MIVTKKCPTDWGVYYPIGTEVIPYDEVDETEYIMLKGWVAVFNRPSLDYTLFRKGNHHFWLSSDDWEEINESES